MFGVGTVFMVIRWVCISDNLLEMRGNKYCMSTECSEDNLPLVTIITPTYNSNPQYLKEAIESVLVQTYPKIEYIITDDGSKTFSNEFVEKTLLNNNHGNVSWRIIKNKHNIGTVRNVNGAIQESHGKYIFFLAHDDVFLDSECISDGVNEFNKSGAHHIFFCSILINEVNNKKLREIPTPLQKRKLQRYSAQKLYLDLLVGGYIIGSSTAYSKDLFTEYGLFDEQYVLLEDYPKQLELHNLGIKVHYCNRTLIRYRSGGVSIGTFNQILYNDNILLNDNLLRATNGINKMRLLFNRRLLNLRKYCVDAKIDAKEYIHVIFEFSNLLVIFLILFITSPTCGIGIIDRILYHRG